jgi:hypothetical protein
LLLGRQQPTQLGLALPQLGPLDLGLLQPAPQVGDFAAELRNERRVGAV